MKFGIPRGALVIMIMSFLASSLPGEAFTPVIPEQDDEWDWLKLDSGEWLKGQIRAMYDDELEFDSDHFGVLTIDWHDISELRSASDQAILINSRETVVGRIRMQDSTLMVVREEQTRNLDQTEIVSIASNRDREIDKWAVKLALGANLRGGNVEQADYSMIANVQRRTSITRFNLDFTGNYSYTKQIETANSQRANSYFDYFFSKRFFVRPATYEYYRDVFQNIDNRQTLSASLGYTVVDKKKLSIDTTIGPSWQNVKFVDVLEGESSSESSKGAIASTLIDWELAEWLDFIGTYRLQWAKEEAGGASLHTNSTFNVDITKNVDFGVTFIWDWMQSPTPDETGYLPAENDYRLIFSLGMDL